MRRLVIRSTVAVVVTLSTLVFTAAPAAASGPGDGVEYAPPVDAPIQDPFRAPSTPYGPGNRGLEYATGPGTPVRAAADGTVTFAGVVAGTRWITVRHADGVRTTYGAMDRIDVAAGAIVSRGEVLGTTAGVLLFTARVDDSYVDPATLFDGPRRVYLVPEPLDLGQARSPFAKGWADRGADALLSAVEWELHAVATPPEVAVAMTTVPVLFDTVRGVLAWNDQRHRCTPPLVPPPPPPPGRRVAVLVGGLGSSSTNAAITDVDTPALGYATRDILQFSYAGGRVPSDALAPELAALPAHPYEPHDTVGDIGAAGGALADDLRTIARALPAGVSIDVIAHSQGGLVTRAALAELAGTDPDVVGRLGVVATLGTPHRGADLASLVRAADENPIDGPVLDAVQQISDLPMSPDDVSVRELAPGSPFLRALAGQPLPAGPRYVSIAARGDAVVPSPRADLDGAANVVVAVDGVQAHDQLPGSGLATRELALAIGGLDPTCQTIGDLVIDRVEGGLISNLERTVAVMQGGG